MAIRKPTPRPVRNKKLGRMLGRMLAVAREKAFKAYAEGAHAAWRAARNAKLESLAMLAADPASKWASPYVRRLAVLEHCDEVLALHRAEAVAKAEGRKGSIEPALVRELSDLWCILEMCRRADPGFATTCEARADKFRPW